VNVARSTYKHHSLFLISSIRRLLPIVPFAEVGADETTAQQGGRAKYALMNPLRSGAVEQSTLVSPLRILAVADDTTATQRVRFR
jgi:hypothetical protein